MSRCHRFGAGGWSGISRLDGARDDCIGGRTWWAHCEFTRINIALTILTKEIEESLRVEPKTS
jgi:hypothetical protein